MERNYELKTGSTQQAVPSTGADDADTNFFTNLVSV